MQNAAGQPFMTKVSAGISIHLQRWRGVPVDNLTQQWKAAYSFSATQQTLVACTVRTDR